MVQSGLPLPPAGRGTTRKRGRRGADLKRTGQGARLGGGEFVILQSAIKTVAESRRLSEQIISRVSEPGTDVRIGVSIGVALAGGAARDGLDLSARADFALYQAKEQGRNTFWLYDDLGEPKDDAAA